MYYHIQVPKKEASIQLSKLPSQTMATQQVRVVEEKPVPKNFKSIFAPLWGSFKTLQRMESGAAAIPETAEAIPKPLATDKLNVVGEEHNESRERREKEEEYVLEYMGLPNYWREEQFRARYRTPEEEREALTSDSYSDQRPYADPFVLRFSQDILTVELIVSYIYETLEEIEERQREEEFLEAEVKEWFAPNEKIEKSIDNLAVALDNLESAQDGFELTAEEKIEFLGLREHIQKIKQSWLDAMGSLYDIIPINLIKDIIPNSMKGDHEFRPSGQPNGDKIENANRRVEAFDVSVKNLKDALAKSPLKISLDTTSEEEEAGIDIVDKISERRAIHMHEAANTQYNLKGVWKIGRDHVEEIKELYREKKIDKIKYNLVTQDDFNFNLRKFQLSRRHSVE